MSALPPVPGVVNQVHGVVGQLDTDDCSVAASIWAALAVDISAHEPTVPEFRAAAGNPDDPTRPDGLTLDQVVRGSVKTWPYLTIAKYRSTDWATFERRLDEGWSASLGVLSVALPSYLRCGFLGAHQIGVVKRAHEFLVANPLAKDNSRPLPCPRDDLRTAARKHGLGTILAALFQPWEATNVKVTIPDGTRSWGTATTTRDTMLWRSDGAKVPLAKGTSRAVFSDTIHVDGVPCYEIRTGGSEVVHYLRKTHATFKAADLEQHRVTLQIDGQTKYSETL